MMSNTNRPLRIALDANEANVIHRVGSNVYAFEIINQLYQLVKQRSELQVTVLLSSEAVDDLPASFDRWQYQVIKPKAFWTQWALPWYLFWHQQSFDVLYTPGHYAPRYSAIPYVSSVMDLAFLHFPEQFKKKDYLQLKDWTSYSVRNAKKVVTISAFSQSEIEHFYQRHAQDIVIAYPAASSMPEIPADLTRQKILRSLKITQPFILHLGTIQPRKNIIALVEAFEHLKRSYEAGKLPSKQKGSSAQKRFHGLPGLQLVLAGKEGWLAEPILERIEASPFRKDIIITGFIDSTTKMTLLKEAQTLAMVGRFEGFGIPALEALMVGLIPVISNQSSLPEVVGKAGIPVNPDQVESIADGLEQVLSLSAKEKAQYRKLAREQIKQFSWTTSATQILSVLEKVGHAHQTT